MSFRLASQDAEVVQSATKLVAEQSKEKFSTKAHKLDTDCLRLLIASALLQ